METNVLFAILKLSTNEAVDEIGKNQQMFRMEFYFLGNLLNDNEKEANTKKLRFRYSDILIAFTSFLRSHSIILCDDIVLESIIFRCGIES